MILPQGYFEAVTNANVIFFYLKKKSVHRQRKWAEVTRFKPTSVILIGRVLKKPKISKSWNVQNSDSLLFSPYIASCSCFSVLSTENSAL